MYTYHYGKAELGDFNSPLDKLKDVIDSNEYWEVKKTVYNPAELTGNDRLEELWVQSVSTTSGQILAMQFRALYGAGIEVAYSRDTDLEKPWDEQPEAPVNSVSREGTSGDYDFINFWGTSLAPSYIAIVIGRDLLHVMWQGGHNAPSGPNRIHALFAALDKTHNYLDGVVWITSHKSGKSWFGVQYNEHWYQEGFGETESIEGLQARINDLAPEHMFDKNYRVHGLYVSPVSVHCNTGSNGADTALELAGFLPSGVYGAKYHEYPNLFIKEKIDNKWYVSMPSPNENIAYINTLLYPLS